MDEFSKEPILLSNLGMQLCPVPIMVHLFLHFLICVFSCPLILSSTEVVAPVFCSLPFAKARLPGSWELWISPGDFLEAHLISELLPPSIAKDSLANKDALLFLSELSGLFESFLLRLILFFLRIKSKLHTWPPQPVWPGSCQLL